MPLLLGVPIWAWLVGGTVVTVGGISVYEASKTAGQAAGEGISDAAIIIGLAVAASIVVYTLKQPGSIKA